MQRSIYARRIEQSLQGLDWNLIKGSTLLSMGTVISRILGMAFSLVLAKAFVPEEYGTVRYAITLGMIFSVGTQPFGQHVLARFIGKYKHAPDQLQRILPNAWFILAVLFTLTMIIAVSVLAILDQLNVGILAIILGVSCYYAYWGLCRGYGNQVRLIGVNVTSNLVQLLVVVVVVYLFGILSPVLAMVIFGLSYLLPIAVFQLFWPMPTRFDLSHIRKDVVSEILRFSGSIWGSHIGYVVYNSIAVLLLARFSGAAAVGIYALANTLARSFLFVPEAISTLLMPRIAASSDPSHASVLKKVMAISVSVNSILLVIYLVLVEWFVTQIFGIDYFEGGITTYAIMALAMIVLGTHTLVTAVLVGKGKPSMETVSRVIALIATAALGWLLIPDYGPAGAALAMLAGAIGAVSYYAIMLLFPKSKNQPSSLNIG